MNTVNFKVRLKLKPSVPLGTKLVEQLLKKGWFIRAMGPLLTIKTATRWTIGRPTSE